MPTLPARKACGVLTVTGSPLWNIGHRVLLRDERGEREGYIESVDMDYDYTTGRYITQLKVTRLWYLSGLVDERLPVGKGEVTSPILEPGQQP